MMPTPQEFRKLLDVPNVGASDNVELFRDNKIVRSTIINLAARIFNIGGNANKTLTLAIGDYTLLTSDGRIEFNIALPALATLPDPTTNARKQYYIINHYESTKDVSFSRTINGDSSFALTPNESIDIYSNGTEYMRD